MKRLKLNTMASPIKRGMRGVLNTTSLLAFVSFVFLNISNTRAQQDPHFTQYMDNTVYVNPAYAGSRGMMNITGLARFQWVGFKGAPMSQTLSFNTPLRYESVGLGLSIVNDKAGPLNQTLIYGDFSYTIPFKKSKHNAKLAFGVKAGMNLLNATTSNLVTTSNGDQTLGSNIRNVVTPNFGVGIYYHMDQFYFGVSAPKLLEAEQKAGLSATQEKRHYFFIAGGVISLKNPNYKLRPTTMLKFTPGAPVSWDISLALIIKDKVTLGAMYRVLDAAGGFIQYQFNPQFKLGYAFDIAATRLVGHNYGTHEVMLSYDFNFSKKKILSPRYF